MNSKSNIYFKRNMDLKIESLTHSTNIKKQADIGCAMYSKCALTVDFCFEWSLVN
jgi:hypothetical protein